VGVARAVIQNPKLILADEPTGNLHSEQGDEIMQLFKRLNEAGTTIIQVTHSERNATYGNRVIQLKDGWVVSEGKAGKSGFDCDFVDSDAFETWVTIRCSEGRSLPARFFICCHTEIDRVSRNRDGGCRKRTNSWRHTLGKISKVSLYNKLSAMAFRKWTCDLLPWGSPCKRSYKICGYAVRTAGQGRGVLTAVAILRWHWGLERTPRSLL